MQFAIYWSDESGFSHSWTTTNCMDAERVFHAMQNLGGFLGVRMSKWNDSGWQTR